jgi:hypothetical protein
MRRALLLALLGLASAATPRGVAAQTVTARLGGELTGFPFSVVMVPIAVDMSASGGEKLGSYTARLVWNPAALSPCLDQYCGYNMAGNFPLPQLNGDSIPYGVLKLTAISPVGVGGLVTLTQLPFTITDTAGTPLTLSFSEMSAAGTFTNLLTQLTVASGTICPARGRWGDIDRDGNANSRDALMILSTVVGLPIDSASDTSLADVNADGRVQSVDALIILSYAVGLEIPGQRVLLLAPTSCGTGSARTLSIFPPSAELAPNQTLPLLLQARDTAGRLATVSDAVWRSSDYDVATIDGAGVVTPRAAGTATITGELGPGVRATMAITVLARRAVWETDARVTGAALQLGNAAFPFEHPARAFPFVSEGDTIHVALGTYDFVDDGQLSVGVVIRGGALGDTSAKPVFRDAQQGYHTGLQLEGGLRTVVQNVVFRNFSYAIDLDGVRNFALEDSRIESLSGTYGTGIYACSDAIDTVRVDRSVLVGDSGGSGLDNDYCVERTALVLVRDSRITGWYDGIVWTDADSMVILRSVISDNDDNGIQLGQEYDVNPALYVAHSRLERNYYEAIYGYPLRRVVIDTTVITASDDDAIDVEGDCGECGNPPIHLLALHGDTIYMNADDYSWLRAYDVDTAVIDGTVVRFPDATNVYADGDIYGQVARVTNSKFLNASGGTILNFNGRDFFADSVTMTGCSQPVSGCDRASGFYLYSYSGALDIRVRHSSFSKIAYPLYAGGGSAGIHEASELSIDSAAVGISIGGDSTVVRDNVLTTVYGTAIVMTGYGATRGPSSVADNSITCGTPYGETAANGIVLNASLVVHVERNVILGPICNYGITVNNLTSGSVLRGNTLRQLAYGIWVSYGDTTTLAIDSNTIAGSYTGVGVQSGRVHLTRNSIGNGNYYGLNVAFPGQVQIASDSNAFVGNFYAIYSATDSVDATNNWWGDPAGPGPLTAGDSVAGSRIATSPFLDSLPANLPAFGPAFAPRTFMAAAASATSLSAARPQLAAAPAQHPARVARPAPAAKRPRASRSIPAGLAPERAAAIQRSLDKRAAHEAERVSRQAKRRGPS